MRTAEQQKVPESLTLLSFPGTFTRLTLGRWDDRNHFRLEGILLLFSSVAQSCPTLWHPINRSMPGLSVHHQLLESTQTHVHWIGDAIQPSQPVILFSSCPQSFPASGSFQMSQLFTSGGQSTGLSASASLLPMNTQDCSPLGWTGWISLQSKGLSRVFSKTTVQKHQFFSTQLSSPSNSHIHTRPLWKNHSLDETCLCWQSNVSAF